MCRGRDERLGIKEKRMNEMKLVESCFRNMGLTRRQVKTLSDKIAEYIASNRAAGISGDMDDSRQEYHRS